MNKSKNAIDYKILHKVELELNTIKYEGIELGNLLSFYFDRLYRNDYNSNLFRKIAVIMYSFLKPVAKNQLLKNCKKELIYFRTGIHRHYQNMQGAITCSTDLSNRTLMISPRNKQGINSSVFFLSNFFDLIKIIYFLTINYKSVKRKIDVPGISGKLRILLYFDLVLQLQRSWSLKKFVKLQAETKLIGADYDRGPESSLFFAVAKSLGINSFTLQHGVLNPPVGYSPVNANEIWVWGEMARLQLLELGVPSNKIKITGTPIVERIEISEEMHLKVRKSYKLKGGKTYVLALSNPDKSEDLKLVSFFADAIKVLATSENNYFVKIHPARDYSSYQWIKDDFNIDILPQQIPLIEFIHLVDVLLAHTSGLALESLYYGKTVGITDILDRSPGNGLELNKYFGVPLLKFPEDILLLNRCKIETATGIAFYKTGESADKEIARNITFLLS